MNFGDNPIQSAFTHTKLLRQEVMGGVVEQFLSQVPTAASKHHIELDGPATDHEGRLCLHSPSPLSIVCTNLEGNTWRRTLLFLSSFKVMSYERSH